MFIKASASENRHPINPLSMMMISGSDGGNNRDNRDRDNHHDGWRWEHWRQRRIVMAKHPSMAAAAAASLS